MSDDPIQDMQDELLSGLSGEYRREAGAMSERVGLSQFKAMQLANAKLRQDLAELRKEVERLQLENNKLHTECGHLQADLAECRRLLRKICESPVIGMPLEQGQYDYTKKVVVIEDDVLTAARDAAGGGDE